MPYLAIYVVLKLTYEVNELVFKIQISQLVYLHARLISVERAIVAGC